MAGSPQPPSIGFQASVTKGGDIQGSDGRQTSMRSASTNLAHLLDSGQWLRRIGTSGEGWKTSLYQSYGTADVHRRMKHLQQLCGAVEAKSPQPLQFFGDLRAHCPQCGSASKSFTLAGGMMNVLQRGCSAKMGPAHMPIWKRWALSPQGQG